MRERHILPSVDQLLAQLAGAQVFSKLDCYNAFLQIPLAPESRHLTTFITPFGQSCLCRTPYGINSTPQLYQEKMSVLLQGIDGVVCLIDDILVISCDQQEYDSRLHAVLRFLKEANVTLNDKLKISVPELNYVGHLVSAARIKPDKQKIAAIIDMAPLTNVAEVKYFLRMVNQLVKLSPSLLELLTHIRELLRKDRTQSWVGPQETSFKRIKEAICSAPTLVLYDPGEPSLISADASFFGLGGSLFQKQSDESWHSVTFALMSMTDVERRCTQINMEALAIT